MPVLNEQYARTSTRPVVPASSQETPELAQSGVRRRVRRPLAEPADVGVANVRVTRREQGSGVLRFVAVVGLVVTALFCVLHFCPATGENCDGSGNATVYNTFNPWRSAEPHDAYISGQTTTVDPNAPDSGPDEFLAENDAASRPTNFELGPDQQGSAQALVNNQETLLQGAEFGDLPTLAERQVAERQAMTWDAPSERTWGEDTSLDELNEIRRGEYVALNDNANDAYTPRTLKSDDGTFSTLRNDEQSYPNAGSETKTIVSLVDGVASENSANGTNDHSAVKIANAAAIRLAPTYISSGYSVNGNVVDAGVEALGQASTPF